MAKHGPGSKTCWQRPRHWAVVACLIAGNPAGFGCSSGVGEVETTVGLLETVRGSVAVQGRGSAVYRRARVAAHKQLSVNDGGLARLNLDSGVAMLLSEGTRLAAEEEKATLESGQLVVRVPIGASFELAAQGGRLRCVGAVVAVTDPSEGPLTARVLSGEVVWLRGEDERPIRAGETLSVGEGAAEDGAAEVKATGLFDDWSGGYAAVGSRVRGDSGGVGALEARVPDEIGMARWPLSVRRLDVRVRIEGPLAVTEIEQVFFNPASETVEGLYRVRVPRGAMLQRFAVDRDGNLVDGYIKEKHQARQQYQAQVYRGSTRDPALLEWESPGAYRARIYPIAAGAERTIVLRYAEWLGRPERSGPYLYHLPLASGEAAPLIQEFALQAEVTTDGALVRAGLGAEVEKGQVRVRQSDFRPQADFWMEIDAADESDQTQQRAWRGSHTAPKLDPNAPRPMLDAEEDDYWFLPLMLPDRLFGEAGALDLVIVTDISAGTDRSRLELARTFVEALLRHLSAEDRVAVATADLQLGSVDGTSPSLVPADRAQVVKLLDGLSRVPAGGATDLGNALAQAAALLDPKRNGAVLYVGDGAPTVGEVGAERLLERLSELPRPLRLYAVGVGDEANMDLLSALTRGGGLAERIVGRDEAADVALTLLSHASLPALLNVTVELGQGVESVFPRRPVAIVRGGMLPLTARIKDKPPVEITVQGIRGGEAFREVLPVTTAVTKAREDLRLRWASERLDELLLKGASREEVADLGVRYGLITPFTSYYVPSAAELHSARARQVLLNQPRLALSIERNERWLADVTLHAVRQAGVRGWPVAATTLAACTLGAEEDTAGAPLEEPAPTAAASTPAAVMDQEQQAAAGDPAAQSEISPQRPSRSQRRTEPDSEEEAAPEMDEEPLAEAEREFLDGLLDNDDALADSPAPPPGAQAPGSPEPSQGSTPGDLGTFGTLRGGDGAGGGGLGHGSGQAAPPAGQPQEMAEQAASAGEIAHLARRRPAARARRPGPRPAPGPAGAEENRRDASEVAPSRPPGSGSRFGRRTSTIQWGGFLTIGHRIRHCSDAAHKPLAARRGLWRERLSRRREVTGYWEEYQRAEGWCELGNWRDRRVLLSLMLRRARSIDRMLEVFLTAPEAAPSDWLRQAIFDRVKTPADLGKVREAFGVNAEEDLELVNRLLEKARTPNQRIALLRLLSRETHQGFGVELLLLKELEERQRIPEAKRLAHRLRLNPLIDAQVRTQIGEMYLRLQDETEARRVFSEIVEFAPVDELARRRLGDLYRAHGWFEDAYRQYQTLARIRPDDRSVNLLLAQAAAGSGRVDEALRLEQSLLEAASPGTLNGVSRVAMYWSSVRYAKLRKAAKDDPETLEALSRRLRRSAILRNSVPLRVALTWSHPDAGLSLWASYPGLSLSRPREVYSTFGIEVFDVQDLEEGEYQFEVRRYAENSEEQQSSLSLGLQTIDAELVLIWNEGGEDEEVRIVPIRFDPEQKAFAWSLSGRELTETQPRETVGGSR